MGLWSRALVVCAALLPAGSGQHGQHGHHDATTHEEPNVTLIFSLTDEEYSSMPRVFDLDEYRGCMGSRGAYCVGSFALSPSSAPGLRLHSLYRTMQRWSANWVDNFNHTQVHRGVCVSRRCPMAHRGDAATHSDDHLKTWFESCVNQEMNSLYNMSARLYKLDYCERGPDNVVPPLTTNETAFAVLIMLVLALTVISTTLDLTLSDHARKDRGWALSCSLRQSWRTLTAPSPRSPAADLRTFDGLRVFCMMAVILEHVCWLAAQSYIADTRYSEMTRRHYDVVLMTNSTLVVQIFFLMASFLLANKILLQRRKNLPLLSTFFETMLNRIIRITPSYLVVIWFASSWWQRLGSGPLWKPLIAGEADVCRRKWWTHLIYMNNIIYPDDKCLIQTWYLAADMQLYAAALVVTLLLRGRRAAVLVLAALFVALIGVNFTLACLWGLVPTFIIHRPESVRMSYGGETSFNVVYQSPLGNAAATVAGLLLAHLHHALKNAGVTVTDNKMFKYISIASAPTVVAWAALSPHLLAPGLPGRLSAAALTAFERPVFVVFVTIALLGAINGIKSWWRTWLSHFGNVLPRLSYGALLLHLPLNKALLATRLYPIQLDRQHAYYQWFGVGVLSYAAAVPLALLIEFPTQTLYKRVTELLGRSKQPLNPTHN